MMICMRCRAETSAAATASTRRGDGWMAIVCYECAHDAIEREIYLETGDDREPVRSAVRRGIRAINVELDIAVRSHAQSMANKSRNDHDSRLARAAGVRS